LFFPVLPAQEALGSLPPMPLEAHAPEDMGCTRIEARMPEDMRCTRIHIDQRPMNYDTLRKEHFFVQICKTVKFTNKFFFKSHWLEH
jgi:hypothetical protein